MADELDLSGSSHWGDVPSSSSRLNLAADVFKYNTSLEPELKKNLHTPLEPNGFKDFDSSPAEGDNHSSDPFSFSKSQLLETEPASDTLVGRFDEDFVEARRLALSAMLNKVAKHWVLQRDEDFRIFLESETFTTDIKTRQVSDSKGIISTIGEAFSFSSGKFVDTSEKINERKKRVDILENQFRVLLKSLDQVVASRRELSDSITELANGLALMADVGLSKSLSELVEQFSMAQLKIRDVYYRQCLQDVLSLSTTLEEYIRLIGSIRLVFAQRQKAYFEYQALEQELAKKRVYVEKLQRQGKTQMDKIAILTEDSQEQEKRVTNGLHEYERIGKVLLRELKRFEVEKAEEFRNSVELFLENSVEAQKESIEIWETFYQISSLRK
ncbi:hypothetical protein D0Z03_001114 [Geotrichum reessii]|nr:hypothetical protein D0Z03_001114 [Galactomyces reessii]